jgi:hypothetical protein
LIQPTVFFVRRLVRNIPRENMKTPRVAVSLGPFLSLTKPPMRFPPTKENSMYEDTMVAASFVQSNDAMIGP